LHFVFSWAQRAAEQGHAHAQSRLGRMLLAGEGVARQPEAGMGWVRAAAAQGFPSALHTMGMACQMGDTEGGLEGAAEWFAQAADAGVAASQYELGLALFNGDGVINKSTQILIYVYIYSHKSIYIYIYIYIYL